MVDDGSAADGVDASGEADAALSVEILLFDGFDELDAVGPFEVLQTGGRETGSIEATLVALESADVVTASHGLRVAPDGTLGRPDLLVVPGGGWTSADGGVRRVVEDGRLPDAVATRHADGTTVAAVCTGGMILAAAGLLEGRPAVTHRDALADLEGVADRVAESARVVDDGDVLTAGGVTAGLDLALWILEREFGEAVAGRVAGELEYERRDEVVR